MAQEWDQRAREAAEHYIANAREKWDADEFFRSGEINVDNEILADPDIPSGGRMLEIGCGAGRMTRALAAIFDEVHAVDISAEMIALARRNLADLRNVYVSRNNGAGLSDFPSEFFDFAFSYIVFQHIPSREVIESYIREVHRCLKPGGLFKFQAQGDPTVTAEDSWIGAPLSLADAHRFAAGSGFEMVRTQGEGTQYFWVWFRKPGPARLAFEAARSIEVHFLPARVQPGEEYTVRIPELPGHTIDVRYEFRNTTGVVGRWCTLDVRGQARIPVPVTQPEGAVRVTAVRSRTANGPWRPATAEILVTKQAPPSLI